MAALADPWLPRSWRRSRRCSRSLAVGGTALGRLGDASAASLRRGRGGAAVRMLHYAPLPRRPGRRLYEIAASLDAEREWLVASGVLPADSVTRIRWGGRGPGAPAVDIGLAPTATCRSNHVFVAGDEITGVIDGLEASQGDDALRPRHPHTRHKSTSATSSPLRHRRRPRPHPRTRGRCGARPTSLAGRARAHGSLGRSSSRSP